MAVDTPRLPNPGSTGKRAIGARIGLIFRLKERRGIVIGLSDIRQTTRRIKVV